jgi:Domain of Unknown Function with PDB structure (DUF3857)
MKKVLLPLCFLVNVLTVMCQSPLFDLATVPENVKKSASVIKRSENIVFDVKDIDKAYLDVERTVTVVNENGKKELSFSEYSNKFVELTEAEIKVFDAAGKQINKYKKSDMNTVANGDGLIDEGKWTYFTVTAASYPITIQFKYEMKYKGTLFYPDYSILGSGEGVESSSFTARVPKELDLRYKEKNIKLSPEISTDDKYKVYKWSVKNLSPIEYEEGTVSYEGRYPTILLAPNRFKLYDYDGDMSSWKNFGMWENGLIQGLNVLPEDRKAFFTAMVKNAGSDREKIKLVYTYLQKNFRYVSIQLGIGGYKPFPANFTDQKKYGDCKGLSFYTHAVLNAIGIKSYVALINADYNKEAVDPSFPCNQFNHMILCVPQPKDTIWLECTSNTNDFAVLGNFTENRNALLITENGGVLVPTPKSKSADNVFNAYTKINLQEDGAGKTQTMIQASGEYKQDLLHYLFDEKKDDQKSFIVNYYGFKQPDEFGIEKNEDGNKFTTTVTLSIEKIPEFVAGSKMFLTPRLYKIWTQKLPKAENRRLDFYFECPFEKTDTTVFKLPEGYTADALPAVKNIQCGYASYSTRYWYSETDKSIYSTAKLILLEHKIPAAKYAGVKIFFDDVLKEDAQRIVIKKE